MLDDVFGQEVEDRPGLFVPHALDADGIGGVQIERLFAGRRMGAHHRMEAAPDLADHVVR